MADHSYGSKKKRTRIKGAQCYAINCLNYRNKTARENGITFHKFPDKVKDPERYGVWVRNCLRQGVPSKYALLCSTHFEERWMDRTGQIVRLREDAMPTIFNVPPDLQSRIIKSSTFAAKKISNAPKIDEEVKKNIDDHVPLTKDHNYDAGNVDTLKRKLHDMQERICVLEKKARNAQTRENRAKKMCEVYLKELEQKNLITAELEQKLSQFTDIPHHHVKGPL